MTNSKLVHRIYRIALVVALCVTFIWVSHFYSPKNSRVWRRRKKFRGVRAVMVYSRQCGENAYRWEGQFGQLKAASR
jgi:hypothetical protein